MQLINTLCLIQLISSENRNHHPYDIFGRLREKSIFLNLIRNYEIYTPPFTGVAYQLSVDQARENFGYFHDNKSRRLKMVQDFISNYGLNISYEKPEKKVLLELDAWAYQHWPCIYKKNIWKNYIYTFEFSGIEAKIRSFLFDTAVLLGECYLSLRPEARWYLDDDKQSQKEEQISFNRIVIFEELSREEKYQKTPTCDMEAQVYYHYGFQIQTDLAKETDRKMGYILPEPIVRILQL